MNYDNPLFILHKWRETETKPYFLTHVELEIVFTITFPA